MHLAAISEFLNDFPKFLLSFGRSIPYRCCDRKAFSRLRLKLVALLVIGLNATLYCKTKLNVLS